MRRSLLTNLVILAVTMAIVAGAFASFQRKRSSFERIDFTFTREKGLVVVKAVDPSSSAEKSGLRPGDQIMLIGDTPSNEIEGLQKTLRRIGQNVPLVVARDTRMFRLNYLVPELKIDYSYLILSFIGFLYLAIGLFTFFRGGRRESTLFFFVTLLSFIVYVYTPAGDIDFSYKVLQLVEELATILLPPLTLNFFLVFPRPIVRYRRLIAAMYIPPALLAAWDFDLLLLGNRLAIAAPRHSLLLIQHWELVHFAIYFTLAVVALAYTYRTAAAVGRKQIKWIYLGMALGFLPFLLVYLVPYLAFGSVKPIYSTISILPLALIPLAFAVSILKYKLWDVEVVIKEILAYSVTFIFGMIAFSTINLILSHVIEERSALERNFLAFTSGLLIAGVLIPVKGRIESVIEMLVYRDSYKHRRAIAEFAQELATFHDVHELISMMRERLRDALGLQRMNLFTREGATLAIYDAEANIPRRAPIIDFGAMPSEGPLVLSDPRLPEGSELPWQLLRNGYRYLFPLRNRGELQGLLLLGTKRNEEPLSRDDLSLVESLCAPVALAIENSRLYGRLRRQLEEIRALKEYNENIIESSSSAIAVVASDGTVLTANHAFWELIGGGGPAAVPLEANEEPIGLLFPPYDEMRRTKARSITTNFENRNGEEKEVTITASPLNAEEPDGARVLVIGDITDRVRLERELQDKERLASLGLLAAGVAHEVNTPLTGISSYAQLLLADTQPDDPRYRLLKKMEAQSFRASHLVNNLLDLIANRPRTRELVNIPALIDATVALHEDLFKAKDIQVHVAPMKSAEVQGNSHDLQQVLTNVLLNARDAVSDHGNIWISADEHGAKISIRVKDDGKGIPADLIDRIFEPLVTTRRGQGGTGLGLAITKRILDASNGSVTVESTPGAGATFTITLPLNGSGFADPSSGASESEEAFVGSEPQVH
jgi:PAS domain S-box-containing protein